MFDFDVVNITEGRAYISPLPLCLLESFPAPVLLLNVLSFGEHIR
jgi:hypothetical protein